MSVTSLPAALPLVFCREDCSALPSEALLHLVVGSTTTARSLLTEFGDLAGVRNAGLSELLRVPGVGRTRASQILAAFELSRRATDADPEASPLVHEAIDAARLVTPAVEGLKREVFLALYLSTRHRLLKIETVSIGSLNASIVHPREVFRPAIQAAAAAMILAHNHPSGDPTPSEDDLEITQRLRRVGELLGIEVLDHLIVGANGSYVSFREKGLL